MTPERKAYWEKMLPIIALGLAVGVAGVSGRDAFNGTASETAMHLLLTAALGAGIALVVFFVGRMILNRQ